MSNHVPGPWTEAGQAVYAQTPQKNDRIGWRGACEQEIHNGKQVGYLVAESIWCDDTRRLIAAAPDLLDALEAVWADLIDVDTESMVSPAIGMKMKAAIAKAKGATS